MVPFLDRVQSSLQRPLMHLSVSPPWLGHWSDEHRVGGCGIKGLVQDFQIHAGDAYRSQRIAFELDSDPNLPVSEVCHLENSALKNSTLIYHGVGERWGEISSSCLCQAWEMCHWHRDPRTSSLAILSTFLCFMTKKRKGPKSFVFQREKKINFHSPKSL